MKKYKWRGRGLRNELEGILLVDRTNKWGEDYTIFKGSFLRVVGV